MPPGTCVASIPAEPDLCPSEDSGEEISEQDRGLMTLPYTKPPWHMELYINENDRKFPPRIIGIRDNYPVATCCGLDEETDEANGRLIAAESVLSQRQAVELAARIERGRVRQGSRRAARSSTR